MHRLARLRQFFFICIICITQPADSEQASDKFPNDGLSVKTEIRHRVEIPQIIYFRIGTDASGIVDRVKFNVTPGTSTPGSLQTYSGSVAVPIGDGTSIAASTNGALRVEVRGNVGTLTLSYDVDDPSGLHDGNGVYINYDEILVSSQDPVGLPVPSLSNAGAGGGNVVQIQGNRYGGLVVDRSSIWTFKYRNSTIPLAGSYDGRISYTLSAP